MKNYRFRKTEIEDMKTRIITHCDNERISDKHGNKSAWRLRLVLEGLATCCSCSKREEARRYRNLELYERLTLNDMPNFVK